MNLILIICLLVSLVLALTLHEFAHAWVSNWLGDDTARAQGRLTINPIAHIDPLTTLALPLFLIIVGSPIIFGAAKPVPFNPWAVRYGKWGAAMVAVAGPLTNLLIAIFFAFVIRIVPFTDFSATLFGAIITTNVAFFLFNLIPFPPLDGSRVLYAIAPPGVREVMDRIERAGFAAIALFIFVGYPLLSPFITKAARFIIALLVPQSPLP